MAAVMFQKCETLSNLEYFPWAGVPVRLDQVACCDRGSHYESPFGSFIRV